MRTTTSAAASGPSALTDIAADLKQRLRETMRGRPRPCARRARIPDGTPMSPCRAGRADQQHRIAMREREHQQADQREHHAAGQRQRRRAPVRIKPDERLQHRRGDLIDQRDEADLTEVEVEIRLQIRIDRRQQRLHHVVEQVAEADAPRMTAKPCVRVGAWPARRSGFNASSCKHRSAGIAANYRIPAGGPLPQIGSIIFASGPWASRSIRTITMPSIGLCIAIGNNYPPCHRARRPSASARPVALRCLGRGRGEHAARAHG